MRSKKLTRTPKASRKAIRHRLRGIVEELGITGHRGRRVVRRRPDSLRRCRTRLYRMPERLRVPQLLRGYRYARADARRRSARTLLRPAPRARSSPPNGPTWGCESTPG